MNIKAALAFLGLTKRDAYKAGLGAVIRRLMIDDYTFSGSFSSPSDEVNRFLKDNNYRRQLIGVGAKVEEFLFATHGKSVKELASDFISDHSVTIRSYIEEKEDDPQTSVDDDFVDDFVGEIIGKLMTGQRYALGDPQDTEESLTATDPITSLVDEVLAYCRKQLSTEDMFPDIHGYLSREIA